MYAVRARCTKGYSDVNTARRMSIEPLGTPCPKRIAVFRALQLGDLLCALPVFRALRAAAPSAQITLVGLPWAAAFAARFPNYFDDFLPFPGAPGMPERSATSDEWSTFLTAAKQHRFDLALQLHGDGRYSNPVVAALGATRMAGFCRPDQMVADPNAFLVYPDHEPEIRRLLRLLELLGVPAQGDALEFPLTPLDTAEYEKAVGVQTPDARPIAVLHPGARAAARRWPADRFAVLGDALAYHGLQIVLTGSGDEAQIAGDVAAQMHNPALDLTGLTSLGALAVLLSRARLLVCNDTGVSHLAAALRTPSVVIYTASSPERWAPLDTARHRAVCAPCIFQPCSYDQCQVGQPCALEVDPDTVYREALFLLNHFGD